MFVTVTEKWDYDHSNETRCLIHFKLDEMQNQGKFMFNDLNNYRSVYGSDGSPTKIFTSIESANEYIDFCSNLRPVSMTVNSFETKELLNEFINSVSDPNFVSQVGPSQEEHDQLKQKLFGAG